MKFDCDRGPAARHRRRQKALLRLLDWHPVFAWKTIRLGPGDCRWLEFVDRKGTYHENEYADYWTWEFRAHTPFYA